jgi:subfamily B ATP-binding cassette protein HlyB/CyaB
MLTAHLVDHLQSFLGKHVMFSFLGSDLLGRLVERLEMMSFTMGQTVLEEGEAGDCAYLIYAGKVRVFKRSQAGQAVLLGTLGAGDLFGEQALMHGAVRSATVRAAEETVLVRMPRTEFEALLHEQPTWAAYVEGLMRRRAVSNFLRFTTFLGNVPVRQVTALLDQFQECSFACGQAIVQQGEAGDSMYILKSGEAKVVRGDAPGVLQHLGEGDHFGERALILRQPRFASVIAVTAVDCFRLSRTAFDALLTAAPEVHEHLRRRLEHYDQATELKRQVELQPPAPARHEPAPDLVWETIADKLQAKVKHQPAKRWSWLRFFKSHPFIPQEDETDCGAASLAMIARHHGLHVPVARLRELAHVGAAGASMLSLAQAAQAIGFAWRALSTDFDHLSGLDLPAIAHWKGYHYLVLYEVGHAQLVVGDPAVGLVTMTRQEFEAGWTGKLLLLSPTEHIHQYEAAKAVAFWRRPLAPLRARLATLMLVSLLLTVLTLAWPLAVQLLVDQVFSKQETSLLGPLVGGLTLAAFLQGVAAWLRRHYLESGLNEFSSAIGGAWFEGLLRLPLGHFEARPIGAFLVRLQACQQVRERAARQAITALFDLPLVAGAVGLMLFYHPLLAGAAVLTTLALPAACALFSVRTWQRQTHGDWLRKSAQATVLVESTQLLPAIKDAAAEVEACRHMAQSGQAEPGPDPAVANSALGVCLGLFALGLGLGAVLVMEGQLTLGQFLAFQILLALAAVPVLRLSVLGPQLVALGWAMQRLADVEATPTEQHGRTTALPPLRGLIQLENVSFRYRPESPKVLAGINLVIEPGQFVTVVGRSGAGKSTLAMLLDGFYRATEGTLRMDGCDVGTALLDSLRGQVSLVSGEPALFAGTVRANIALAEPAAAMERVVEAAKMAHAHDFILALPHGYDTMIGPGAMRLSTGQSQGLSLARALLKEPRVLILDDVLDNLDGEAEQAVLRNLQAAGRTRTTVLLSRRPQVAAFADRIIVLEAGQIVESGTHAQLVEQRGLYCFWTSMSQGRGQTASLT